MSSTRLIMARFGVLIVLMIALLSACKEEKRLEFPAVQTWEFDIEDADTLLRHSIDTIRFLPLEVTEGSMLRGIDKLVEKDGLLYLADFRMGKIVAYDMTGKVRFVLNHKGNGPQEYLEIKSFAADSSYIYVVDNFRHRLNLYDSSDGSYVRSLKLPFVVWDMEVLSSGHFIFAYVPLSTGAINMSQESYRIFVTDRELNIVRKWLPYEESDHDIIGQRTYFTSAPQGILFHSISSDDLYLFTGKDSLSRIAVNLSSAIPEEAKHDERKIKEGDYSFIPFTPVWCKDYVACVVSKGDFLYDYVYNVKKGQLSGNDTQNAYKIFCTPLGSIGNRFVAYLDDYSLYEDMVGEGFSPADKATEEHLRNEGLVLMLYDMR